MRRSTDQSALRRLASGFAVGATLLGATVAGITSASAATTTTPDTGYTVSINQGNVPTTAAAYANHSCDEFTGKAATADGWLFVASPDNFTSFEAVFDQGTVFYNDPGHRTSTDGTTVAFPKPHDHLAVTTPDGWTLRNAFAVLDGTKAFFTLSHTCAATQHPKPTVSFNDNCDTGGIVVTLGNTAGTGPADFTLVYGGSSHSVTVPAGGSTPVTVPVDEDTTGSVTVSAAGLEGSPVTHTWARNCSSNNEQTPAAAPTAAFDHGCDLGGIRVTLGNVAGTAPADFTVHYDGADHAFTVAPGASTAFTVPVAEDTSSTVTVTATGLAAQSDSWSRNCSTTVPPASHGVNPAVSFSNACTTGITALLSNMQLDDTTTDTVTFTVTTPSGAAEQVPVNANQIVKRSYAVAEGTTGTVSVEAPGLLKQTHSYAKKCTSVLGEKLTKGTKGTKGTKTPTPAVEGSKVAKLPMTGAYTSTMLRLALIMTLVGAGLALAGRRRYQPRHARG